MASGKCPFCGATNPDVSKRGTYPKRGGAGQRYYCKKCKRFFSGELEDA